MRHACSPTIFNNLTPHCLQQQRKREFFHPPLKQTAVDESRDALMEGTKVLCLKNKQQASVMSFLSSCKRVALLCSFLFVFTSAFQQPSAPQHGHLVPLCVSSESQHHGAEERRQQSLKQGNHPLISLNLNLDALAQSGAAPRAQELLQRIHALYNDGYYEVSPDTVSFNSVLKAWKESDNPEKAYGLLQEMLSTDDSGLSSADDPCNSSIRANVISFNTVILAFAHQGNYVRAQEMLQEMKDQCNLPSPDTVTYNSVLAALAKSPDPGTALIAENLLKEMMQPDSDVSVDTTTFNTVIHAWSKIGDRSAAHRAQQLLDHMVQLASAGSTTVIPDLYSYTTVIQAWAKCGKPSRAQEDMESMIDSGVAPNRFTYTAVMSSLSKSGEAEKAEEVLESMMLEYSKGKEEMKPDTVAFSSVMDGWAKMSSIDKPEAAKRALELLQRMKDLENAGMGPNARTYTSVLTALAKSGTWDACTRARSLLNEMEHEYENGSINLEPTNIHCKSIRIAWWLSPSHLVSLPCLLIATFYFAFS